MERYTENLEVKADINRSMTDLSEITNKLVLLMLNHSVPRRTTSIYISGIHGKSINLIGFKLFLKDVIRIKEKIAHNKDILALHYQKWEVVREVLDM